MSIKVYDEPVTVNQQVDLTLKRAFVNHLLVYNYCLHLLYKEPETPFHILKRYAATYIQDKKLSPIVESAMYNEIYYQFKKFRRNVKIQKHLNDIQYFTFTVGSYQNNNFTVNKEFTQIEIKGIPGIVQLEKPLPDLGEGNVLVYINLSYSNQENSYRLNIYLSK